MRAETLPKETHPSCSQRTRTEPGCSLREIRDRALAGGPGGLDPEEALALLLSRRAPDAVALARRLLERFGSVAEVLGSPAAELARVAGRAIALDLQVAADLQRRVLAEPLRERPCISSWSALSAYLRARLAGAPREAFHVLFLDRRNRLIADEALGVGTIHHAPVYPREVVRRALELNAASVILAHNHPAGDPQPSSADISMTAEVVAAARALGISVHDHVLVARDVVVSLRAAGLMEGRS